MQAVVSKSLSNFKTSFLEKYGLTDGYDRKNPTVFFGLYDADDWTRFIKHKGESTIVFQGMDCKDLTGLTAEIIKKKAQRVICISHWQSETLTNLGIDHEYFPVSATIGGSKPLPLGYGIYFYSSDLSPESSEYYGESIFQDVMTRIDFPVFRAVHNSYSKEDLYEIYSRCFIGIRLTSYDGCPNGVLEMGLMGRRTIFNGELPHAIKWNNVDDICQSITHEYERKNEDNSDISTDFVNFINIPNNLFK